MKIEFKEIKTYSNMLSLFRLLMAIPFFIILDYYNIATYRYITFGLCILAAVTDLLDGYLARKFNEITELGKIIDPLADKICMGVIIIKLFLIHAIPAYYFLLIILRDILIFLGGIYVTSKVNKVIPSNYLGKATVLNIGIVILLTLLGVVNNMAFQILFYLSICLIIASFFGYLFRAIKILKGEYGTI